jgi:outer membrane immunogenic protein
VSVRRYLTRSAMSSLVIATPAFAADMPVRIETSQPVYAQPVAAYNWTGCYLGLEGGGGWGQSHQYAATSRTPADVGLPLTNGIDLTGGHFGGTVGCNYQATNIVFGVEDDLSWTNLRGSSNDIPPFTAGTISSTKENWLDTLRGRVGFAVDRVILYGTGGAAFSNVGVNVCGGICDSDSQTRAGWVAGAGAEWAVWIHHASSLTFKFEYLHVDLGNGLFVMPPAGTIVNRNVNLTNDIIRVGLNWKFNWCEPSMLEDY